MNREQFLSARKPRVQAVTVDGFAEPLYVRALNGKDRDGYEAQQLDHKAAGTPLENFRARLVVRALCDADGVRVLNDDDVAAVGDMDGVALGQLFDAAARLNGLNLKSEEEEAAAQKK